LLLLDAILLPQTRAERTAGVKGAGRWLLEVGRLDDWWGHSLALQRWVPDDPDVTVRQVAKKIVTTVAAYKLSATHTRVK